MTEPETPPSDISTEPGSFGPVRLVSTPAQLAKTVPLLEAVASAAGNVPALLALARETGRSWPQPGDGSTARLWELLASVSAVDVAAGRVFEPHVDALAILAQAGRDQVGSV